MKEEGKEADAALPLVELPRCPNCKGRLSGGCYLCHGDAMSPDDYRAQGAQVPR